MNLVKIIVVAISTLLINPNHSESKPDTIVPVTITFLEKNGEFSKEEKAHIQNLIYTSEKKIRGLMPTLPDSVQVQVEIVDWNLNEVGGVTGRTQSNTPPLVIIQISKTFPGGIQAALNRGLASTLYHEFHHLALGWAIQDNKFPPGIDTAMVIEGLAEVFAEEYTEQTFAANHIPEDVDPEEWIKEILDLPQNASYRHWMFEHPDGRRAIGYKAGTYLIRKTMRTSDKNVIELSGLSPKQILEMNGY